MKNLLKLCSVALLTTGCMSTTASTIPYGIDSNTLPQNYAYITDPTGTFEKVHAFQFKDKCGSAGDCKENSVRSEIFEEVWEDNRPGEVQPKHYWYSWNVYLPNNFPVQDTGKLLLGQFHNGHCPHISFTSRGGEDNGTLHLETMRINGDDCRATTRIPFANIQDLKGKWTNFTIEIKWKNNDTGLANLWLDNKQVISYNGITLTKYRENINYLKVGIYQCCNEGIIKPGNAMFTTPKSGPTRESVQ